jgi:holin-like protein
MIGALTQLLLFQLAGEVIARGLDLPIPGPVLGMILMLGALALRGGPDAELQRTSQGLLQHLSLLFVPAGTGVMVHLHLLGREWLPLAAALVISTVATLAVTALVMGAVMRRQPGGRS